MKKILVILMAAVAMQVQADEFGSAQWIGAITKADAHLPEGRNYCEDVLKRDDVKAAWQAVDTLAARSIVLRKSFIVSKQKQDIKRATVCVCGLGFYEMELNGHQVGDSIMAPHWSDYDKTVFYNVFDVTEQLAARVNLIRVLLGNGFYNEQGKRYAKMRIAFGPPTLRLRLCIEYSDGSQDNIYSDDSWQYSLSPITFNSIYGGEDYDARIRDEWMPVVVQEAPKGTLRRQIAKPVRIMETFGIKQRKKNVCDMGQNLSGFPEITVVGKRGQRVKITVSETLDNEGRCSQKQTGRPHYYSYTLKGDAREVWHPHFSYYGFRYIEVEGAVFKGDPNPQGLPVIYDLKSCFIYNSAQKTGQFECSNQLFNDAYRIIDRAIRSNWQSVWTDCPHREKLGWLEQDWLNGEGLLHNYDCRAMIEQTMQQMADAQHANGSMPEIAPEYSVFQGSWAKPFLESPEWGGALVALPMMYYSFYADDKLLRQYYDPMLRYVDYLATQDSAFILKQGLGDWYDYGPGKAGLPKNTPMPLVSTAHYFQWTVQMAGIAQLLGKSKDEKRLLERAEKIRAAFNKEYYNKQSHQYATGSQAAQSIALEMNLVPETDYNAVLDKLIADIHAHGDKLTTGDVGTRYLFRALAYSDRRECQQLLYKMLNHYELPGYGYQIKKGMTTLAEQWNPELGASRNHFMLGHLNNLLIPVFLGIDVALGDEGVIYIAPTPVGDLTWCKGATQCAQGRIACSWRIEGKQFVLDVDIPQGTKAVVTLPYSMQDISVGPGTYHYQESVK